MNEAQLENTSEIDEQMKRVFDYVDLLYKSQIVLVYKYCTRLSLWKLGLSNYTKTRSNV